MPRIFLFAFINVTFLFLILNRQNVLVVWVSFETNEVRVLANEFVILHISGPVPVTSGAGPTISKSKKLGERVKPTYLENDFHQSRQKVRASCRDIIYSCKFPAFWVGKQFTQN